ncbi:uncharacterized protein [Nicotiana tomentosiformis]|uniref:uncharacterized protein n=1 Tax=Nicotiana tomentosiformis TaxID=4098 RepID=UPI00388C7912
MALALVVAARKLRPYFQYNPIAVVTTFPVRDILHKPELSGRLAKWAIEMSEFDIEYKPRTAIKSQGLVDFVADFSPGLLPLAAKKAIMVSELASIAWTLFMDGASNLVVNQVYEIFDTKEERMQQYVVKVQALLARFREWSITHISREDNVEADALANLGSMTEIQGLELGMVEQLMNSILDTDGYSELNSTSLVWDWRNEIIDYLEHERLPKEPKASRVLGAKAARYSFKKGQLYRKSFRGPLARCLGASEANYVMREVHEGICSNHSGADSLVLKLVRAGYYWPRMEQDAKDFVRKCEKCQRYAPLVHQPTEPLYSVLSPCSFMKWGMDIVGPLPPALGKQKETGLKNYLGFYGPTEQRPSQAQEKPNLLFMYGAEALILVEVGEPTLRYFQADKESNNEAMLINLELLEERKD